jgi:hypothetical protein
MATCGGGIRREQDGQRRRGGMELQKDDNTRAL